MAKAMDLLMWELDISGRDKVNPVIWKLADQVEPRHGIDRAAVPQEGHRGRDRALHGGLQLGLGEELGLRAR